MYSFSSYQRLFTNLQSDDEQNVDGIQLAPAIEYAHELKNKLMYTIQYNYASQKSISSSSFSSGDSSNSSSNENVYKTQTHGLRFGLGKNTKLGKYLLYSGISVPIQYSVNRNYTMRNQVYNFQGQQIAHAYSNEMRPNQISLGTFLTQSFYYPVCKQLYVGVELNVGFNYTYSKGIRTEVGENVDSWGSIHVIDERTTYQERYSNMQFLTALSVRYTWGK